MSRRASPWENSRSRRPILPPNRQLKASLAHKLSYFGVRVKLVEPGYAPTTRLGANAIVPVSELLPGGYADFAQPILEAFAHPPLTTTKSDVAEANSKPFTIPIINTAFLPERTLSRLLRCADGEGTREWRLD